MGVKQSKQSVDISSTPKKAGPEGDVNNGKSPAEVKEVEATKVNGEAPTNGEAPANGEAVKAEGETAAEDKKEVEAPEAEAEEAKEGEAKEGENEGKTS